ncbi:MAG: hypothetical protein WBA89_29570 [Microcoleus sp.]
MPSKLANTAILILTLMLCIGSGAIEGEPTPSSRPRIHLLICVHQRQSACICGQKIPKNHRVKSGNPRTAAPLELT